MNHSAVAMKEEIRHRLGRNDLYDILDVKRNSSDDEVRKSYKQLAFKFHPDKNKHAGAKEVFTKISHAYSVLANEGKKQTYDYRQDRARRYQEDLNASRERKQRQSAQERAEKSYEEFFEAYGKAEEKESRRRENQRAKKQFQKQQAEYEKRFTKLFSQMFDKNSTQRTKQQFQRNKEKQNTERMKKKYQEQKAAKQKKDRTQKQERKAHRFITIFVFVLISMVVGPSMLSYFTPKPLYSFSRTSMHTYELRTPLLNFTYFVSDKYFGAHITDQKKAKIHEIIDKKNIISITKECAMAKSNAKIMQQKAYRERSAKKRDMLLHQAKQVDSASCDVLLGYTELFPQYIRQLVL